MSHEPILLRMDSGSEGPAWRWLARAEQARRIARILSPADAEIAEAYAVECEVHALRHVAEAGRQAIAA